MKAESYNISILPGDGIGKEISKEARKLIDWISSNAIFNINLVEEYVGVRQSTIMELLYQMKH